MTRELNLMALERYGITYNDLPQRLKEEVFDNYLYDSWKSFLIQTKEDKK